MTNEHQGKPGNFSIGNIGSVGGDIVNGDKVEADRIVDVRDSRDVNVTDDNEPSGVKYLIAIGAIITAIATLLGALYQLLG